jgi:hypothetical protein
VHCHSKPASENLLKTGPASATLGYDPALRLYETVGAGVTTRFGYDGADLTAEYNAAGTLLRRYVHGPGSDEPLVWYEGSVLSDRIYGDSALNVQPSAPDFFAPPPLARSSHLHRQRPQPTHHGRGHSAWL